MASYNRIILVGNLTRDPQLSYLPSQTPVCEFGIATNERWKDKEGNQREDVCFVDCKLFGKGAEVFCQYMAKGRSVLVEGKLKFEQWTSPEGEKKSKYRVLVENFTFLGTGGAGGGNQGDAASAPRAQTAAPRGAPAPQRGGGYRQPAPAAANANYGGAPMEEPPYEDAPAMGAPGEEPPF